MSWGSDKRWSDKFIPEISGLIGKALIRPAPMLDDQQRNTDLIVLTLGDARIACRVRRNKYLAEYADEFTIRSGRPSGTKTELTKIIEGWGDFLFYGFCDESEIRISRWFLGELGALRLFINRELASGRRPWLDKNNDDDSSSFKAFRTLDIPGFVVDGSIEYTQRTIP